MRPREGEERRAKTCCSASDAVDAQNVADRLDIPFYALDFERDFARIMDQFADEYAAGRTPNPCVMCNIWLKFGKLWSYGKQVGADFVATGHYARMARAADGTPRIARAVDRAKDQSYVLFGLRRELLPHVLFPVGEFPKAEIRAIARDARAPRPRQARQPGDLLRARRRLPRLRPRRAGPGSTPSGAIVDEDGTVLARARGDRGVHDRPASRAGDRRRRAALRGPDRAAFEDGHRGPARARSSARAWRPRR